LYTFPINEPVEFNFHAVNRTDGERFYNDTTDCFFATFGSNGSFVYPRVELNYSLETSAWRVIIPSGTFAKAGEYYSTIYCNKTGGAGFVSFGYGITLTGNPVEAEYIAIYFFLFFSLIGGMFLFNRNKKDKKDKKVKMKVEGDWDLFKMFRESIKEFRFFLNWIFITLILFFLSNFFFVFGFNLLHTISVGVFYLSLVCGIPVVIIFALQFLDVRKRCEELGDIVSWGGKGE
jgi:hypothetical protein